MGLCYILLILQGEGHKCSQIDVGKYQLFFFSQERSIPDV